MRLRRILALHADFFAVFIKQEREGQTRQREEGRDARGPVDAEGAVHLLGKQGEASAEKRAQHGIGGEDGGGVDGVGVDEVVHAAEKHEDHAEAEGGGADDADAPVDGFVVGPGEPEDADRESDGCDHGAGQACFGGCLAAVFALDARVALVVDDAVRAAEEDADGDADEGEAGDALGPAALFLEDDGEGAEEHVERAVDDGHVDGDDEHDRFGEEQHPGPGESLLEGRFGCDFALALLEHGNVVLAGAFGEGGGALLQDDWCVGLGDGECAEEEKRAREDGHDALKPAPADRLPYESTDDGTNDGP